ncbi:MFS family permease [Kitasatospora sp. MAP12-15]|uniref:MFS transporter n=1 Tax=unclassified Kitasatospora TaxID=2633591 RepID=UPI0024758583|nr:MFS transporter [Kitasatospora sp. MAP12-44]MDH6108956.1 putative MFS family arabinose efflux permease [Kitasatospora sp. MAP12-44]
MRTATALAPALPRSAGLERSQVHAVAACYFVASFAALGLPPYLTAILPGLGDPHGSWAGLLYIMPTVFSALGAPLWGRLADRFGRKRLLLRAQLGLSVSFLLAGAAGSLWSFALALVLQGFLGGTFAATNGYLAAALEGPRLSKALTLMQGSARASLVAAPILVGALSPWISPHRQYLLMAVLPLAAAALLARLPEPGRPLDAAPRSDAAPTTPAVAPVPISLRPLYLYEFAFVFATIISFPYLIALVDQRLPGVDPTVSGLLFALPHLCYLLFASRVHSAFAHRPHTGLALGFALVAAGLAGHGPAHSLAAFVLARAVLGAGLTLGLVCLSVLAADAARGRPPGRMFGTLELISKGGAVAAGVVAMLVNAGYGAAAPVLVGTAAALVTALVTALATTVPRLLAHSRWSR